MYETKRILLKIRLVFSDAIAVLASFFIAHYFIRTARFLPFQTPASLKDYSAIIFFILILWLILLSLHNAYSQKRGLTTLNFRTLIKVSIWGILILVLLFFIFKIGWVNRSLIFLFSILSIVPIYTGRYLFSKWIARQSREGKYLQEVLIIGTGEQSRMVANEINLHPGLGFRIKGFLSLDPSEIGNNLNDGSVIGTIDKLFDILHYETVDNVVFALPLNFLKEIEEGLLLCDQMGISGRVVIDLYDPAYAEPRVEEFFGRPTFFFSPTPQRLIKLQIKRLIDFFGSFILLSTLFPLLAAISMIIKITSKGPVFFKQERSGLNGRRFTMYKFRTMVEGAEKMRTELLGQNEMDGPVFKIKEDPRITPIGKILRRFSLDELPQLINVIKGDMSMVGPRPLPQIEAFEIKGTERRRLSMKPGITCLWQVSGRNILSFKEWMKLDLEYIDKWSLWLDIKIIFKTVSAVLRARGAY